MMWTSRHGWRYELDDKISRLARGDNSTFNEDAAVDLAGYLLLFLSLGPMGEAT